MEYSQILTPSWRLVIRPIGEKIILMGLYGRPGKLDSEEANLTQTDKWLIWKTKDDIWTHNSKNAGFHQVFSTNKENKVSSCVFKIEGWWRKDDIEPHQTKNISNARLKRDRIYPERTKDSILPARQPWQDEYTIDVVQNAAVYSSRRWDGALCKISG